MAAPIYKADNKVKINACKNATSISKTFINAVNGTAINAPPNEPPMLSPALPKTKIKLTNVAITTCPAVILAKRRTSSVTGLMKIEAISMGNIKILMGIGTSGIQRMCCQ